MPNGSCPRQSCSLLLNNIKYSDDMSTKSEKERTKQIQDKCQSVLNNLLRDEDNKYCVDCDSKGPRWASWNLGVFLCIRCAGIHRNLGVHISKVKSVNLDAWTPEQVVSLQQMGNSRARAVYEANLPDNFRRPQSDSSLESFIRAKYEHKKYIAKEWVPPQVPKVSWDQEIDGEMEKQKWKKKTAAIERKSIEAVEVPHLPKPRKNAERSPKVSRSVYACANENPPNTNLLELQQESDIDSFSGFVSANVIAKEPPRNPDMTLPEPDALKSEEESFFNQIIPSEKEKVKLTKDNILALYANTPTNATFNSYATQPFTNFNSFPAQPQPPPMQIQNGFAVVPNLNQLSVGGQLPSHTAMPFIPVSNYAKNPQLYQAQMQPVANPAGQNQLCTNASGLQSHQATSNPFFPNQSASVQQQFAALSINKSSSNSVSTLTTTYGNN